MWQERNFDEKPNLPKTHVSSFHGPSAASKTRLQPILSGGFDEVASVVPPVTVVVEDEICGIDLSNAVPGHLIAYEDMENDLLLVGDLNWKDFVRVAKRIRILPIKAKSRKQKDGESNI
ncbi:Auxin-responsive protein IAA33 [Striga hermonthica]|uniref:Auxin-responsive protein n=1 Tax=Striga hermonthica TaxID=68872 RepID=A0A9N7RNH9_STRHE|nr:Auxin-responsive protein IAA33 [Striga hermonthica]